MLVSYKRCTILAKNDFGYRPIRVTNKVIDTVIISVDQRVGVLLIAIVQAQNKYIIEKFSAERCSLQLQILHHKQTLFMDN